MKKLLALLLALALTLSFTGCHGTLASGENPAASSSYPVPDEFDTSRRYEVTFWAKNDTNMAQVNIYKQAIADFEALYPNITVNLRLYTDYGKIYNDVITNIATDTTPNVCITYPDHIATYLTGSNVVAPLDGLFADERYGLGGSALKYDGPAMEEIIPQFLEECSFSGSHYAVPFMRSTEACYVNKTYVEALGYTLPETLTEGFRFPYTGVLHPTVRAAAAATRNGKIGVIATATTIRTGAYERELKKLNPELQVISRACPLFVPLVENGYVERENPVTRLVAEDYLRPLREAGCDTLILGCTHYPVIAGIIGDVMGPGTVLIDSGKAAADYARQLLEERNLLAGGEKPGSAAFYVSDDPLQFSQNAALFLGERFDDANVPPWAMKVVLDEEEFTGEAARSASALSEALAEEDDLYRDLNNS